MRILIMFSGQKATITAVQNQVETDFVLTLCKPAVAMHSMSSMQVKGLPMLHVHHQDVPYVRGYAA